MRRGPARPTSPGGYPELGVCRWGIDNSYIWRWRGTLFSEELHQPEIRTLVVHGWDRRWIQVHDLGSFLMYPQRHRAVSVEAQAVKVLGGHFPPTSYTE